MAETRKAVEETIRICQDEDVLKGYLERQREEVMDMMLTLFDQEPLMKNHDASVERRTREEERISSIRNVMNSLKTTAEKAMDILGIPASKQGRYSSML